MSPESSEWLTAGEAAKVLGVSKARMARLLAPHGPLVWRKGALDTRVKLVRRADVEQLAAEPRGEKGEHPKSEAAA